MKDDLFPLPTREMRRLEGLARGRAHNQELHELGHIRRHGGYQKDLPLVAPGA